MMGCYIDLDQGIIKYTKNGKDLGTAFNIPGHMKKSQFFPAVVLKVRKERKKNLKLSSTSIRTYPDLPEEAARGIIQCHFYSPNPIIKLQFKSRGNLLAQCASVGRTVFEKVSLLFPVFPELKNYTNSDKTTLNCLIF